MAVVTGGADDLGCFLRGMGLAAIASTLRSASGWRPSRRVPGRRRAGPDDRHGGCVRRGRACPLWASKPALEYYDIVLLACEGGEHAETKPSRLAPVMHDWLGEGGKVFATHFQYYWFKNGPTDFQNVATWTGLPSESAPATTPSTLPFTAG